MLANARHFAILVVIGFVGSGCPDNEGPSDCTPLTCDLLEVECGSHSDGCTDSIFCGDCSLDYECINGRCAEIEPSCVDIEPCDAPPADYCDGNELVSYDGSGSCQETENGPVCEYTESRQDCGAGYECVSDASGVQCVLIDVHCFPWGTITCGDTLMDDTTGAANLIESYSCFSWLTTGGEHVYSFVAQEDRSVTVALFGMTVDLYLFILEQDCSGAACIAFSASTSDEEATFEALAGVTYYIVVDGYGGAEGTYNLSVACDDPCEPDCTSLECGPDPVCGFSCGTCPGGQVCSEGACIDDPCQDLPFEGCCDGNVLTWCEDGELYTIDCGISDPPNHVCGWNEEDGFFDCGGNDPVPDGISAECPWVSCERDCTDLECGPDPVCGLSCGTCATGFVCESGTCVLDEEADELTCGNPGVITCASSVTGDTTGAANVFSDYPACVVYANATGGEHIYLLTVLEETEVTVDLTEISVDLELFVLEGTCDPAMCIALSITYGNEQVSFPALPGVPYFIVVDGNGGAAGSYRLATTCAGDEEPNPDFCEAVGEAGCCDGAVVRWCEGGDVFERDCVLWGEAGIDDFCDWDEWLGYFWCGGEDPVPDGIDPICPVL